MFGDFYFSVAMFCLTLLSNCLMAPYTFSFIAQHLKYHCARGASETMCKMYYFLLFELTAF